MSKIKHGLKFQRRHFKKTSYNDILHTKSTKVVEVQHLTGKPANYFQRVLMAVVKTYCKYTGVTANI